MINIKSADHALDVIARAMNRRWRVTLGFWEVKKDDQRRPVKDAQGNVQYEHTVRTMEFFDVDSPQANWDVVFFTGMDACPRDGRGPGIRRVRADRITSVTVHKYCAYRMPNAHFIGRVRAHAAEHSGEGWGEIAALSDTDLWALIDTAHSSEAAIAMATEYVNA